MIHKSIIENNNLIAKFLGAEITEINGKYIYTFKTANELGEEEYQDVYELHYHRNWNWLMHLLHQVYRHMKENNHKPNPDFELWMFTDCDIFPVYDIIVRYIKGLQYD